MEMKHRRPITEEELYERDVEEFMQVDIPTLIKSKQLAKLANDEDAAAFFQDVINRKRKQNV